MEEFKKQQPLKRIEQMKYLSHEHHYGLQVCWKIRQGLSKSVEYQRIKKYLDWFYNNHLKEHFTTEELVFGPLFEKTDPLINTFYTQHNDLRGLFEKDQSELEFMESNLLEGETLDRQQLERQHLEDIERALNEHIRFEERELFGVIQEIASDEQLEIIANEHRESKKFKENLEDEFWL